MVPQQPAYYASAAASAPPLFENPTFPSVGFAQQHQCLPVQVGIPAGAAVYGPGAQQAAHMGNTAMGPPPYSSNKNQTSFVQGMGSDNAFAAPPNGNFSGQWQGQSRPPRSPPNPSYPPGFEPRHNNAAMWGSSEPRHNCVAMGGPSVPHPHPHPHPHQHPPHPHPHPHPQPQPQPQTSCQGHSHAHAHPHPHPHPHPQPQPGPQLHPGPQPQTSCQGIPQQEQSCHYTSMPFPTTPNAYLPNFQVCDTNGTAIGVPVMGTPAYMDATCTVPPPAIFQNNQPVQPWQPSYPENSASKESVPQSFKSTFAFTKYFRGNQAHTLAPPKLERQLCSNRWQPPNTQRIDQPHSGIPADHSRSSTGQSCSSIGGNSAHLLPPSKPETQPFMEGWKPSNVERINQSQAVPLNGFLRSDTGYPCSVMEGNKLPHGLSPSKVPMQPCANGRQPPNTYRNDQPQSNEQLKVGTGHPSSAVELNGFDCSGKTQEVHVNSRQESQLYKSSEFRGNAFKRGMGKRPDQQQLQCDPCERTFTSSEYLEAHLSSHIKCGEEGCTFEASGKIIKEHKVVEHGKTSAPTTFIGRKALALRSMEGKEEVTRWREERKKNYPTSANILLKAEEKKKREAEGEFVDEESQKRRQRMSEVLARQKELGFQAAEIPAYYFSVHHDRRQRPNRVHRNREKQQGMVKKVTTMADSRAGEDNFEKENLVRNKRTCPTADRSEMSHKVAHTEPIKVSALQEKTSGKVSKLENDIQDIKSQHASFCCGIESQNNADKELHRHCDNREGAGSRFLPRRKRRKRHSGSGTTNAWLRPTLLSKLLDYDIQKEKSYLLQCCRFIVNNSFLQQWSPAALKHFDWIEAGKPSSTDGMNATLLLDSATRKEMHTLSDSEDSAPGNERHTLSDSQDSAIGKETARVFKREETSLEVSKSSLANTKDPFDVDGLMKDVQHASVLVSQDFTTKKEELDLIIEEQPSRNLSQPCLENDVGDADSKTNFTAQNKSVVDRLVSGMHTSVLLESPDSHNQFIVDRLASGTHPSVSLLEQPNTDTHLSYHDMDAGEVASGISGSIV